MPPGPCAPTAAEGRAQRSGAGPKGQSCRHASAPASCCRKPGRGGGWRNSCPRLSRHPHALGAAKGPAEEGPKPAKSSPNCCPAACQAPEHPACPPPPAGLLGPVGTPNVASGDRWGDRDGLLQKALLGQARGKCRGGRPRPAPRGFSRHVGTFCWVSEGFRCTAPGLNHFKLQGRREK